MKGMKIFYLYFLVLYSTTSFAAVLEFPFSSKNKSFFYLNKSILDESGISIAPSSSKFSNHSKDYTLINFETDSADFQQITLVNDAKVDKKSGLFFSPKSKVSVKFNQSLENGVMLEFWAKPLSTIKSNIFSIQFLTEEGINKEIAVLLEKGRIKVKFQNMFIKNTNIKENISVSLLSNTKILPDVWSHHRITYNPENGKLTYYNNHQVDNETWATSSRLPRSSVLFLDLPQEPHMTLGGDYRGLIDQFIISNNPNKSFSNQLIGYGNAYIHTRVIPLPERAVINLIDLESILPTDTDYMIDYRIAEIPFDDNTPTEMIPWRSYNKEYPDKNLLIEGKYIQARIHLLSDPEQNVSPLIKKMKIYYSSFEIPLKPIDIKAYSSKGNLILSMHQSVNKNISAYKIYLGTKPDTFFGDPENGIESPILVPANNFQLDSNTKRLSYTIKGLTSYKLYYAKIKSVTVNGVESDYSETVKARIRTLE